ncbi:BZ3500_MvSof-1268-A1-R1_Chr9g10830 [Microbotryum saponariae]|uniref:BZ3500_MvSof-1268-A1-R1_Chr9g10830 protein n=1 Tax=Microbotryum saponariae TaxID=289078 RepID=A0A2X0L762_9BASI|nr:BZ3501_MvSof-1269-A2-R1_Chr9g10578 [Microbotryum saponariae]SDA00770.1 BZ3500_MvSof-1268-A1-R1_Chr9g10830 [Microbotryum saponariae]
MSIKRIIATTSTTSNPSTTSTTATSPSSSSLSAFTSCTTYIQSLPPTLSNSTKLHLYALYKIATSSPYPSTPRPGIWDFSTRAKWDAWNELGRGEVAFSMGGEESRTNAIEAYVEEGMRLGWRPERGVEELEREGLDVPEEEVSAGEGKGKRKEGGGAGAGAGSAMVKVSTMLNQEHEEDDDAPKSPLHELALDGDATRLEAYLQQRAKEDLNVDELDSYGFTPIHLATDRGHLDLVKILLRYGANKNIPVSSIILPDFSTKHEARFIGPFSLQDQDGNTPLQLAEMAGHDELLELLR